MGMSVSRSFTGASRLLCAAAFILGPLLLQGCETVEPWQRAALAKPIMALNANPQDNARRAHTFNSREAASGSASAQGGGCGCN
jgi:hypothetical protein